MKLHKSEIASIKIARAANIAKWRRFETGFHEGIIEMNHYDIGPQFNVDKAFENLKKERQAFVKLGNPKRIYYYANAVAQLLGWDLVKKIEKHYAKTTP